MPPFLPVRYLPSAQEPLIRSFPLTSISAVAHEPLPSSGNHWSLYLHSSSPSHTHSLIHLDITPSYTQPPTTLPSGSKAILIISLLPYHPSPSIPDRATKICPLSTPTTLLVSDVVDLLLSHGRHRYEFNDQGQGCRAWTDRTITLLHQHGLVVRSDQVEDARAAILLQHPDHSHYPLVQGAYY